MSGSSSNSAMIAGVSSVVGLVLLMLSLWLWYRKTKKAKTIEEGVRASYDQSVEYFGIIYVLVRLIEYGLFIQNNTVFLMATFHCLLLRFTSSSDFSQASEQPHRKPLDIIMDFWHMVFIMMVKEVTLQSGDKNNTLHRNNCRLYKSSNGDYLSNLNTTFSSLRRQLSDPQAYYAFAQTTNNGDLVFAFALCREYLSTSLCLACFESAVNETKSCGTADGGNVIYDDCSIKLHESFVR
ncbi:hypothetical protein L1987_45428 [Smallanthus sonchifolius]|uniref:Uncharacterized protein n=1 Tax=Smallanthus sonchifolius TaxID=185202 RepID=A0ACB9FWR2_9ASTR|nr:hypothetical protein L1987_45428 [Smallanthus sonchifolius]